MTAQLIPGNKLTAHQIQQVKNAFGYRWTIENMNRAKSWTPNLHPTIAAIHDEQWINEHAFYFCKDGTLAKKPNHCEPAFMAETR